MGQGGFIQIGYLVQHVYFNFEQPLTGDANDVGARLFINGVQTDEATSPLTDRQFALGVELHSVESLSLIHISAGSRLEAVGGRVTVRSPMPGSVVALGVGLGARVDKGGPLMTLGAMKMELKIVSPVQGTVVAIHVAAEQQIPIRCALLEIEPD